MRTTAAGKTGCSTRVLAGMLFVLLGSSLRLSSATFVGSGTMNFLSVWPTNTLTGSYASVSAPIGVFKFGPSSSVSTVYISRYGYLRMGQAPLTSSPSIPSTSPIISPYGARSSGGTVRYTTFSRYHSDRTTVNNFIESKIGTDFDGTYMMVAEWDRVYKGSSTSFGSTSTFQAALITNGTTSYAVFIYDCGGMGWDGAEIGWAYSSSSSSYSSSSYNEHFLSGTQSERIGCYYSSSYSAVIYRIDFCYSSDLVCANQECESYGSRCDGYSSCDDGSDEANCPTSIYTSPTSFSSCFSYQFTCDSGKCIPDSYECDGTDDCYDNSDEDHCANSGLAIGLSIGIFFFLFFIGVPICIGVIIYCSATRRRHQATVRVVRTTPSSTSATVVTSSSTTQNTSFTNYPATQPQQGQPGAYAPQPDTTYKDAQFSAGVPPPSYNSAVAFPSYAPPEPSQAYPPMTVYPPQQQQPPPHGASAPYPTQAAPYPTQNPVPQY